MSELSNRAVLVSLAQRAWTAKAVDHEIASATEQTYEADPGTLRVVKELTPKEYINPVYQIMWLGRKEHYRMTVHGLSHGQHLLATALLDRYVLIQMEIKDEFTMAVDRFCAIYPDILSAAPKRLNKAYKEADFPTPAQIRSYFDYRHRFTPVPNTNDWRLEGIESHDLTRMRGEVEDEVRTMFNRATQEVFERAREVLASIAHQAETYVGGPGSAGLRDATIQNLKEISELVVKMNVTNDPLLDQIGKEMIESFAHAEGARLRKDADLRKSLAASANSLLAKIAAKKELEDA